MTMVTYLSHKIAIETQEITINTTMRKEVEQDAFDLLDQEQVLAWYARLLKKSTTFSMYCEHPQQIEIRPDLKRFSVTHYLDNENYCQYDISITTTLDNKRSKNPKSWLLEITITDDDWQRVAKHTIEWSRLSEESLDWTGFKTGLERRNLFNTIKNA